MRLFAALRPPDAALAELREAVAGLHGLPGAGRLRWADPAGWHVALAFYGDVPAGAVPALCERLGAAASEVPPHGLRLAGGGRFGRRVLWAGVTGEGTAVLGRLAASAVAAGPAEGAAGDAEEQRPRRAFEPHLTLARGRGRVGADLAPFTSGLAGFDGGPWTAACFGLYRSRLPRGREPGERPRYETLAVWPLTGRSAAAREAPPE